MVGFGVVALVLTEADSLRVDETGGLGDLAVAGAGSGEGAGRVGEDDALSVVMEAMGGKHRRLRYSST